MDAAAQPAARSPDGIRCWGRVRMLKLPLDAQMREISDSRWCATHHNGEY
jgi:hypothetical protein